MQSRVIENRSAIQRSSKFPMGKFSLDTHCLTVCKESLINKEQWGRMQCCVSNNRVNIELFGLGLEASRSILIHSDQFLRNYVNIVFYNDDCEFS